MIHYGCAHYHESGLWCRREPHVDGAHTSVIRTAIIRHLEWWCADGDLFEGDPIEPVLVGPTGLAEREEWSVGQFARAELLCFHNACEFWQPKVTPKKCDKTPLTDGKFVATVSAPHKPWEIETYVKNLAVRSGQVVDWHPVNECGQILCIGDVEKVVAAANEMWPHMFVRVLSMGGAT